MLYGVWKACLRCGLKPPGIENTWEECSPLIQAHMLAYNDICEYEEAQQHAVHGVI